jgi:radical SAM superfamily enzyme YgiQ (UPF0313 family)
MTSTTTTRILLSTPLTPLPWFVNGRDNLRYNYGNSTYGQDIFSVPTDAHAYGLHLIAQNISARTTVLENPRREDFARAVAEQRDVVGIHFLVPYFSRVLEMCRIVRRLSPRSTIVLGGHGVQCFAHSTGREPELLALVDHVCRGDGIRFMRQLLHQDVDAPVVQDLPPSAAIPFRFEPLRQVSPVLVSALGCTNRCAFCAASAFFDGKRVQLASPRELFETIKRYLRKHESSTADILDDNFLWDKDYVRELGALIRTDPLCQERDFGYYTFASLAAIAQYGYEELVEHGVRGLLIGVESKFADKLERNTRRKMIGIDRSEVFRQLLDHGIYIDGSTILGWDFHTPANIIEDIDYYVSLGCTSDQIVCLVPLPDTQLSSTTAADPRGRQPIN